MPVVLFFPHFGVEQDVWMPFPYLYLAPFLEKAGYKTKIIDATGKWKELIGSDCKYAASLFRDSVRVKAICNIPKYLYNLLKED